MSTIKIRMDDCDNRSMLYWALQNEGYTTWLETEDNVTFFVCFNVNVKDLQIQKGE